MARLWSTPRLRSLLLLVPIFAAGLVAGGGVGLCAEPATGTWQVDCREAAPCQMMQAAAATPGERPIFLATISKDPASGHMIGIITAPLRVYLAPGIRIRIDGNRPFKAAYELCDEAGCHAGFRAEGAVLQALRRGKRADVTIWIGKERAVVFPLALSGFSAAFAEVEGGKAQ